MTDKQKVFVYSEILAILQGSIEGIMINLELKDPNVNSEIKRLKAALKLSDKSINNLKT